jgi:hypothetical protein
LALVFRVAPVDEGDVAFGSLSSMQLDGLSDEEGSKGEGTSRRRVIVAFAFAVVTMGATFLLARRLTNTSWPLQRAHKGLVAGAVALYFSSYVLRALGWQKLFPASRRPGRSRCLTACGAAAASGVILPFRLDYLVKIGTLRRMPGVKLGLEAIALSIISLGLVDAVAFLPLSISATATTSSSFRLPLVGVVLFGIGACGVLVTGRHLGRLGFVKSRARVAKLVEKVASRPGGTVNDAILAWVYLLGCWTTRATGSMLLLDALGAGFSPTIALIVLCVASAAALIPITSGGAVANVGATAAVLLALGVHREQAINFGLASGLLLCTTAAIAAIVGLGASFAASRLALARAAA